jgi:hypothetical protein
MGSQIRADLIGIEEVLEGVLGVDDVVRTLERGGEFDRRSVSAPLAIAAARRSGSISTPVALRTQLRDGKGLVAAAKVEDIGVPEGGPEVRKHGGMGQGVGLCVMHAFQLIIRGATGRQKSCNAAISIRSNIKRPSTEPRQIGVNPILADYS